MKINYLAIGIGLVLLPFYSCQSQQPKNNEATNKTAETKAEVIEHLTASSFKQKVFNYDIHKEWKFAGNKPAIIDFYADWCAPCRRLAPIISQVADQYQGKVVVYKIDVDKEKELAGAFGIQGIPAILFIPVNGQPQMSTGLMSKDDFDRMIKDFFKVN